MGTAPTITAAPLAWGARVSPAFRANGRAIAGRLGVSADDLMACMAWETGRTFSPSVANRAGSGAVGLIQFMPGSARVLGTSTAALAAMKAEAQLAFVEKYFQPYRGRLHNLSDLYMAILWPAAVGRPDDYVLFDRASRPAAFRQNAGLDANGNGAVTKGECAARLYGIRDEGLRPENAA